VESGSHVRANLGKKPKIGKEVNKMMCGVPHKNNSFQPFPRTPGAISLKILQTHFLTLLCLPSFIQVDPVSEEIQAKMSSGIITVSPTVSKYSLCVRCTK